MGDVKGIVLSQGPTAALSRHVAGLDLARRALSTPLTTEAAEGGPAFVELWGTEAALRSLVALWPFAARAWLVHCWYEDRCAAAAATKESAKEYLQLRSSRAAYVADARRQAWNFLVRASAAAKVHNRCCLFPHVSRNVPPNL